MINQYQTTQRLNEPPEIITNKDLLYLQDALSWELLASKKAHHYAMECENNELRQQLEHVANVHQQHYQQLLEHLHPQVQQQNISEYSQVYN